PCRRVPQNPHRGEPCASQRTSRKMAVSPRIAATPRIFRSHDSQQEGCAMLCRRHLMRAGLLALTVPVLATVAAAQSTRGSWPVRPVKLVVGFAPGGGNDIIARLLADKLSRSLGQPIIVENKPGAGGGVAAAFVKAQPADGYTLLIGASGAMVIGPAVGTPAEYDTLSD